MRQAVRVIAAAAVLATVLASEPVGASLQPLSGQVKVPGSRPVCLVAAGPSGTTTFETGIDGAFSFEPPDPSSYLFAAPAWDGAGGRCDGVFPEADPGEEPPLPEVYGDRAITAAQVASLGYEGAGAAAGGTLLPAGTSGIDICLSRAGAGSGCLPLGGRVTQAGGAPVPGACVFDLAANFTGPLAFAAADGTWSAWTDEVGGSLVYVSAPFDTGAGACDLATGPPPPAPAGSLVPELFPNRAVEFADIGGADPAGFTFVRGGGDDVDVCLQTEPASVTPRPDCIPRNNYAARVRTSGGAPVAGARTFLIGANNMLSVAMTDAEGRWSAADLPARQFFAVTFPPRTDGTSCFEGETEAVGAGGLVAEWYDDLAFDPSIANTSDVYGLALSVGAEPLPVGGVAEVCLSTDPVSAPTRAPCPQPPAPPPPAPPAAPPAAAPPRLSPVAQSDLFWWPFRSRLRPGIGDGFVYRLVGPDGAASYGWVFIDRRMTAAFRRLLLDVKANDLSADGMYPEIVIPPRRGRAVVLFDGRVLYLRR